MASFYEPGCSPGPIFEAACWVHARRSFFVMTDLAENARRPVLGCDRVAELGDVLLNNRVGCRGDRPGDCVSFNQPRWTCTVRELSEHMDDHFACSLLDFLPPPRGAQVGAYFCCECCINF